MRYREAETGREREIEADFCVDCAPSLLVAGWRHNFSPPDVRALRAIDRGRLFKIAFQAKRRFREEDAHIYGGISWWTNQDILQIWYPSHGLHAPKGILVGAYSWNPEVGLRWGLHDTWRSARRRGTGRKVASGLKTRCPRSRWRC